MPLRLIEFLCEEVGPARCAALRGREAMNELPRWEVELHVALPIADTGALLGAPATIVLSDLLEESERRIDAVIVSVVYEGREIGREVERPSHRYRVSLSAPEFALTQRAGYRVWTDKATFQVVEEVLRDAGLPPERLVKRLATAPRPHLQCTQYGETEWGFIERLLGEEGISYWFDHDGERGQMILGDDARSHDGVAGRVVRFVDPAGLERARSLSSLELSEELVVTQVHVRDFDVRNPDVPLDGRAGEGSFSYFEYPAQVFDEKAAQARAQVRLEQLQRFQKRAEAESDTIRLAPGRLVDIEGAPLESLDGRYLVVAVDHEASQAEQGGDDGVDYRNVVTLVPHGEVAFRPALPPHGPSIDGTESAVVTGPSGQEIHVDDLGRIKLRFPWDPSGITDDRSSAWTRALQPQLGGIMMLPRVGWEVSVMYLHGDPDMPVVTGRLYNATAVTPYPLPAAAATTSIQSETSPKDGTTHELRFGDAAGLEAFFIHATRDLSALVGGKSKTDVKGDHTRDVGESYFEVVQGSQENLVLGMETIDVGTDWAVKVNGAARRFIGPMELINASGNRLIAADGLHLEVLIPLYGLQCNQSNIKVEGAHLQIVGGQLRHVAGLGANESVAGARVESITAAYGIQSRSGYGDIVYGGKRLQVKGAATEKAGGGVAFQATLGRVKAGSGKLEGRGAPLHFKASATMNIEAGTLVADNLELSGGALRAKGGTTYIDASAMIKRPSGEKIT